MRTKSIDKGRLAEKYIDKLASRAYLRYWCYPNPTDENGTGKEICDLLILFGDTAVIISVKHYEPCHPDYKRFNRNVIKKSSRQLLGAYRKLFESKTSIFIKHPSRDIEEFNKDDYKNIHLLTVNTGIRFEHYEHTDTNTGKRIINILDSQVFSTITSELDTISDLVEYLNEREKIFSVLKDTKIKCDEKDLLAIFLLNNRKFPDEFYTEDMIIQSENARGAWKEYIVNKSVIIKKMQDDKSYFIDKIVDENILNERDGELLASKFMSLNRFERRIIAKVLFEIVAKFQNQDDFFARRYMVYKGLGFLFIYYPPNRTQKEIDEIIQLAPSLYAYKRNNSEQEIVLLAATQGLKQWKYGLFYPGKPDEDEKKQLDIIIKSLGWFEKEEKVVVDEEEYPI